MMKHLFCMGLATAAALAVSNVDAAPITPGNLMVYRWTSGGAPNNDARAVFIDEYTPGGTLMQSFAMPTAASGSQLALTAQANASLEGWINRSVDGRYLMITGYNIAPGAAGVVPAQTLASTYHRVIGRMDYLGNVDTSTAVNDLDNGADGSPSQSGSPRSAISTNGTDIWVIGDEGGVRYTTFGTDGASTKVSARDANGEAGNVDNVTSLRHIDIFGGQLFISTSQTASPAPAAINRVGLGTPATSGQIMTGLLAGPGGGASTPVGLFLADLDPTISYLSTGLDTLYVASDQSGANGHGLDKYSWDPSNPVVDGGNWLKVGQVGADADNFRGLTGVVTGSTVTLYASRDQGTDNVVSVVDPDGYTLAAGSFSNSVMTQIITATASTMVIRGVEMAPVAPVVVPEPATLSLLAWAALACRRRRHTKGNT